MDDCQRAFEKWASNRDSLSLDKSKNGGYKSALVGSLWVTWKAAWEQEETND